MIKNLAVKNFRGLDHIELDGMGRLNLISGKNNVGKSSILEALFLFMNHTANDSFKNLNSFRGNYISDLTNLWETLFYNMDTSLSLSISITQDTNEESVLTYKKDTEYLPKSVSTIPNEILAQFRSAAKETFSLMFNYTEREYNENGHFVSGDAGILRQMSTSIIGNEIKQMRPTRFINSTVSRSMDSVIDGIGKLELSGEKRRVVDILRELDSSIEDIVTVSHQGIPQLHIRANGKWIPLQYAGDGVMKLLYISLAILENKDGLLLIDEIEAGFHYSMYGILWKIVDKISKNSNCQIIATTNSYEMISALKENTVEPDDLAYYRVGRNKGHAKAYRYDFQMLDNALRAELEVR